MTTEYVFGEVNPLETEPRYTTVAKVYEVIGQGLAVGQDLGRDERMTEAIVSCEYAIDAELGRSFPDTGENPEVEGIPVSVQSVARAAAVAIYQSAAAPFGTSGADDFLGTISVAAVVAEAIRRNPQLMGLKVSWGVA